jgi:hypothetical protein
VSGYLVGSAAFKAVVTSDPREAGSIPVHLRHSSSDSDRLRRTFIPVNPDRNTIRAHGSDETCQHKRALLS